MPEDQTPDYEARWRRVCQVMADSQATLQHFLDQINAVSHLHRPVPTQVWGRLPDGTFRGSQDAMLCPTCQVLHPCETWKAVNTLPEDTP